MNEAESLYASGKRDEAAAALRSLGTAYQDTPAAAYATRMLARWEKEKRPAVSDAAPVAKVTVERPQADTPSGDAKKAASLVRLGKLLLSRSPDKARPYFEQAIEAAPDSDAAAEAKELLARRADCRRPRTGGQEAATCSELGTVLVRSGSRALCLGCEARNLLSHGSSADAGVIM